MAEPVTAAHLALAEALADAAGDIIRRHFREPLAVDDKADLSPVTIADREAEAAMRRLIEARFPDHGIIGEEHGAVRAQSRHVWVLDPIDGTRSFISGVPLFGTLIALVEDGRPVLGVVDQPISRERWVGAPGHGTTLNGRSVRCRPCPDLGAATLFATSPEMFRGADDDAFARLRQRVKLTRYGADCYAYALVATGFVDCVVESGLKVYDYCALVPVIENAGGIMTDWQGRRLGLVSDGRVLALGDPRLHAAAQALLTG